MLETDTDLYYTGYSRSASALVPSLIADACTNETTVQLRNATMAIRSRIRVTEQRAIKSFRTPEPKSPKAVHHADLHLSGSDTDDPLQDAPPHSMYHEYHCRYVAQTYADAARYERAIAAKASTQGL